VAVLVAALALGCGAPADDDADVSASTVAPGDRVIRAADVGGSETDVFLPPAGDGQVPVAW